MTKVYYPLPRRSNHLNKLLIRITEELIKTRPLLFEQRPYNRLLKRCTPLLKPEQLPTTSEGLNTYGEELELDFRAFEGVIARIQLLRETNKREVERYEKEKGDIRTFPPLPLSAQKKG